MENMQPPQVSPMEKNDVKKTQMKHRAFIDVDDYLTLVSNMINAKTSTYFLCNSFVDQLYLWENQDEVKRIEKSFITDSNIMKTDKYSIFIVEKIKNHLSQLNTQSTLRKPGRESASEKLFSVVLCVHNDNNCPEFLNSYSSDCFTIIVWDKDVKFIIAPIEADTNGTIKTYQSFDRSIENVLYTLSCGASSCFWQPLSFDDQLQKLLNKYQIDVKNNISDVIVNKPTSEVYQKTI